MITRYSLPVAMAAALTAGLLIASVSPARANLVADPGFESCTTFGSAPPPDWSGTAECGNMAHSGSFGALFIISETLSQSIATTPGDTYDFSFWLANSGPPPGNSFTSSFGSDTVLDLTNASRFPYTFEDFTVTAAAASTTISFASSGLASIFALDDVSVTAVPAPEPATLSVLAGALGLFLLTRRAYRRRQA